ncbi:MAG: cation:proton antiporter [Breznakia sp.]
MTYYFLLDIALILLATKLFGLLSKFFTVPQVVGALLAGLVLGPVGFNVLQETDFLSQVSEVGVVILMFSAGLETDISELKKTGKISAVIAVFGVLIPLLGGWLLTTWFYPSAPLLEAIFMGVILTATSVSITVETLKEFGKLSSRSGNIILGAALMDDILGIIILTIVVGFNKGDVHIGFVLSKIIVFFILSGILGYFAHTAFDRWMANAGYDKRRFAVLSFAFCLLYAFVAEEIFGVADITGAFVAGLIIAKTARCTYVTHRVDSLGYMFFTPVFLASIGLKAEITSIDMQILSFAIALTFMAIVTKWGACYFGGRLLKLPKVSSLRVGVGMICRGEVALIIAAKGVAKGLVEETLFTPIIVMVIVTTVITPILLKMVYQKDWTDYTTVHDEDPLIERIRPSINE